MVKRLRLKPRSIWLVIAEISRRTRVGLLTNMYPKMFQAIKEHGLLPAIEWEVVIDSSVKGIQKPDPEIFKLAEGRSGAKGKEILFVENTAGHVKAAQKFGWQTFLYDSSNIEKSSDGLSKFFHSIITFE